MLLVVGINLIEYIMLADSLDPGLNLYWRRVFICTRSNSNLYHLLKYPMGRAHSFAFLYFHAKVGILYLFYNQVLIHNCLQFNTGRRKCNPQIEL